MYCLIFHAGVVYIFADSLNMGLSSIWGFSSVGRASDLHSEGQEFESPSLHSLFIETVNRSLVVSGYSSVG